jgi:hypothetical protein
MLSNFEVSSINSIDSYEHFLKSEFNINLMIELFITEVKTFSK